MPEAPPPGGALVGDQGQVCLPLHANLRRKGSRGWQTSPGGTVLPTSARGERFGVFARVQDSGIAARGNTLGRQLPDPLILPDQRLLEGEKVSPFHMLRSGPWPRSVPRYVWARRNKLLYRTKRNYSSTCRTPNPESCLPSVFPLGPTSPLPLWLAPVSLLSPSIGWGLLWLWLSSGIPLSLQLPRLRL